MMEKWSRYLWTSLIYFACFFEEYLSIGIIFLIFNGEFGVYQKCIHLLSISVIWAISMIAISRVSKKYIVLEEGTNKSNTISIRSWIIVLLCLLGCKVMTFIDWHTLKVIGEWKNKEIIYFLTQYIYYFFEIGLICSIISYGQRAFEVLLRQKSHIPFGGLILAVTWGAMHFFSRGVIDPWNGISCMIFSVLSGIMYLKLNKNTKLSYIFIALGYLL